MTIDERASRVFAAAWIGASITGALMFGFKVHWLAGLLWVWVFTGLGYWATASRVPPRGDQPEPRTSPDFSDDTPIHTVE